MVRNLIKTHDVLDYTDRRMGHLGQLHLLIYLVMQIIHLKNLGLLGFLHGWHVSIF